MSSDKTLKRKRTGDTALEEKKKEKEKERREKKDTTTKKTKTDPEPASGRNGELRVGTYHLVPLPARLEEDEEEEERRQPRRYLYMRQHRAQGSAGSEEERQTEAAVEATEGERTLFVTNLPADTTEADLQAMFARCCPVEAVELKFLRRVANNSGAGQQGGGRQATTNHASVASRNKGPWLEIVNADADEERPITFAHVRLSTASSLPTVLSYDWNHQSGGNFLGGKRSGVRKWLAEYSEARPNPELVMAEVDAFMADFDRKQKLAEQQEEAALGKPDADGFITVRRKGRKNTGDGGVPIVSAKSAPALKAKAQNKEATGVLLDFYRFQRRENRRKQLADLRTRFEEDKKKIAKLRAQRKFKPF